MSDTRGGRAAARVPRAAGHDDRPVRADDGRRLLEARAGPSERAIFTLTFRQAPFGGGYAIAAGIAGRRRVHRAVPVHRRRARLPRDAARTDDKPLFEPAFLDYLADLRLAWTSTRVPEGTVVFPHEPLRAGHGLAARGAAPRDARCSTSSTSRPSRDQGRARDARRGRRAGARVRAAPGAGHRRRPDGVARGVPRRLRRRPRTCSPASCSASRCAARTRTAG